VSDVTLKLLLLGEDRASKAFHQAGAAASGAGDKMKRNYTAGVLVAATAVAGFAKVSVDKFKEVGAQTLLMQRYMGGSAEAASRMRFAATQSGVSVEDLAKGMGKLSKTLVGATDQTKTVTTHVQVATGAWRKQTEVLKDAEGHFYKVDKMIPITALKTMIQHVTVANPLVAKLGFAFRDAQGHLLPMDQLLPKVAEKFKNMPAGAEKTALALALFGKSGMSLMPFLNKGAAGIAALSKESDKFGLTLTGKNLDAIKKAKAGQREWSASLDGLRVQFGAQILPLLNTFVGFLRDKVIPMITAVTGFLQKHADVAKVLGIVLGTLIVGLKALAVAQGIVNTVMAMNPIGLVVVAVAALVAGLIYAYKTSETFRKICHEAFHAVADAFMVVVTTIVHAAADAFGWVPGLGPKLRDAARQVDRFRDDANTALDGITTPRPIKIVPRLDQTAAGDVWRKLNGYATRVQVPIGPVVDQSMAADVWRQLNGFATRIQVPIGPIMEPPTKRASGGPVTAGMPYIVGDGGRPELFIPSQNGTILPNVPNQNRANKNGFSGGQTVIQVNVNGQVYGSTRDLAGVVLKGLQELKGSGTRMGLG
jgi:hypothetical protein